MEEASASRFEGAKTKSTVNYMSDSEANQRSSEKLQGRSLPPKMVKKQESSSSLIASQKMKTGLDLTTMS